MPETSAASIARAYALLGVSPSSSNGDLARAYRALVKRWHPDQYTNDAVGHAEASAQMREINRAFSVIEESRRSHWPVEHAVSAGVAVNAEHPPRYFGQRLTDEDLREIAEGIGNPHVFDTLAKYLFRGCCVAGGLTFIGIGGRFERPWEVGVGTALLALSVVAIIRDVLKAE